jgi:hypothetical protein
MLVGELSAVLGVPLCRCLCAFVPFVLSLEGNE